MKPSIKRINKEIKELRRLIDTTNDVVVARIAYAVETALIWATIDTKDWDTPVKDAIEEAEILRKEYKPEIN